MLVLFNEQINRLKYNEKKQKITKEKQNVSA